jgi:hypothetical protein
MAVAEVFLASFLLLNVGLMNSFARFDGDFKKLSEHAVKNPAKNVTNPLQQHDIHE